MSFATVVNCMDGRIQLAVIDYVKKRFGADHVDNITEAGPVACLSGARDSPESDSILRRLEMSVVAHESRGIAIVAHHDCAGNRQPREKQIQQLDCSVGFVGQKYSDVEVIGLWVDENWFVREV